MVKHVVMWKFRDGADGKTRHEHALWIKKHLESLVGVIPEIITLEVGVNENTTDAAFDAVLIATYADKEAMGRYAAHPEHKKISEYCKTVRETRTVVDYTI
jgi:hypothetical protein